MFSEFKQNLILKCHEKLSRIVLFADIELKSNFSIPNF